MVFDVGDIVALSTTFKNSGGTPTDPTTVTLTITPPSGSAVVVTGGSLTHTPSTGVYSYNYTPSIAGVFRYKWVGTGTVVSTEGGQFEVRAYPEGYFLISELRAQADLSSTTTYPDTALEEARDWVEGVIERETGTSFIARSVTETLNGSDQDDDGRLVLSRGWVLAVTAVTVNGVALTSQELADVVVDTGGLMWRRSGYTGFVGWESGRRNIVVTYDAGYTAVCPPSLRSKAVQAARWYLLSSYGKSGIPDRALSISNEFGNINLATPSADRPTGLPEFDAELAGWVRKTRVFGFA